MAINQTFVDFVTPIPADWLNNVNSVVNGVSPTITVTQPPYNADPTGTNDSTAALVAAITHANSIGGGRVYLPAGTYLITSSMIFSNFKNILVYGDGIGATTVKSANTGTFTNGMIAFSGGNDLILRDITWNQNNVPCGTLIPAVFFAAAVDVAIEDCELSHMVQLGLGTSACNNIRFLRNKITLDVAYNSQNNGILISGVTTNAWLDSNNINRTNILAGGTNVWITNNSTYNYKYGGGIGVQGGSPGISGPYYVIGNLCTGGTGIDTDGTYVAGMEFNGVGGVCANNVCFNNSGVGIASFSFGAAITGNSCYSNGTGGSPVHCAGILGAFQSSGQFFADNIISGNTCFDPAGGAGTQLYGYQDASDSRCINNTFIGNNFEHNAVSPFSMTSTNSVMGGVFEGATAYAGGTILNGGQLSFTISVPNANVGDFAVPSYSIGLGGIMLTANVNSPGSVVVTMTNLIGANYPVTAGTVRAKVFNHYM